MPRFRVAGPADDEHLHYIRELLTAAGWAEGSGRDFDLFWDRTLPTAATARSIVPGQRHSHLWGTVALTNKERLYDTLAAARFRLGAAGARLYDFFPTTYSLPEEHALWRAAARARPDAVWIEKPKGRGRGEGVALVSDADAVAPEPSRIVQEYLARPHLLDGHKYTLRFYLLLADLDPLAAHVYGEGFCKVASRPFRLDAAGRADRFAHLTNPDVLRHDPTVATSSRNTTHAAYRARLRAEGVDDAALWRTVRRQLALTVIAAREAILARQRVDMVWKNCGFALLGLDVLVDRDLHPWLLECNLLPSLSVEAAGDSAAARDEARVKHGLIADTLVLMGAPVARPDGAAGFAPLLPPTAETADLADLIGAVAVPRASDVAAWGALGAHAPAISFAPDGVISRAVDNHQVLFVCETGRLIVLDPPLARVWRAAETGASLDEIVATLGAASADAAWTERDARAKLAAWVEVGLLRRHDTPTAGDLAATGGRPPLRGVCDAEGRLRMAVVAIAPGAPDAPEAHGAPLVELPDPALRAIILPGEGDALHALAPAEALSRLALGLLPQVPLGAGEANALVDWLITRAWFEPAERARLPRWPRQSPDTIGWCLEYVCERLERGGFWYSLAYGSMLGAVRDGDVVPWDYDFDLLVRAEDAPRILQLNTATRRDGFWFEPMRKSPRELPMNWGGVETFWNAALAVYHRERKMGDLYAFATFSDGVMRRFDFDESVYWCPHSSFPAFFAERSDQVALRGRRYAILQQAEKWIAGTYGADWRTPYRAQSQGGVPRDGSTWYSDRYEPKLAAEIAWCVAHGWDPARYHDAQAWPRPLRAAGPPGPTERTKDNSGALWWRDLDELMLYY